MSTVPENPNAPVTQAHATDSAWRVKVQTWLANAACALTIIAGIIGYMQTALPKIPTPPQPVVVQPGPEITALKARIKALEEGKK